MMTAQIQAIRIHGYGEPGRLEMLDAPQAAAGEVVVRVSAAGVNPIDWKLIGGAMRAVRPLVFPHIPGIDIAGVVEAVGPGVSAFQPGQAVFGQTAYGAFATHTRAAVETLAPKPTNLRFDEAAAAPLGATAAWQALFDHGQLQPGQRVLIQGAAGGVGAFAVQLAHWKGAHVSATTSSAHIELVRSLGADTVIDYTANSVEQAVHDIDLVLDTVGAPTLASSLAVLKTGGRLVSIGGRPDAASALAKQVAAIWFSAQTSRALLETLGQLVQSGQLRAIVGASYPLSEAQQALEQSKTGHGHGRFVLHITDEEV